MMNSYSQWIEQRTLLDFRWWAHKNTSKNYDLQFLPITLVLPPLKNPYRSFL